MSFESLLAGLHTQNETVTTTQPVNPFTSKNPFEATPQFAKPEVIQPKQQPEVKEELEPETNLQFFTVDHFKKKLKEKSSQKNKVYQQSSANISAYDVFSCSRIPFFRINSYPVHDYSNNWLPIELRSTLGTACHDFLQDVPGVFTETELCLKAPSKRISVRLDGMINHNVLVEIKSCAYSDYEKILKTNKPRVKDFYQTMVYKYFLENHLEEAKQQPPSRGGSVPSLEAYDISHVQFVYVCHELIAADAESIEHSLELSKALKRQLDSRRNPFWFIKTLTIDLTKINIQPYMDYIIDKIDHLNDHLEKNSPPPLDSKYIDKKDCYFCLYNKICDKY